MDPKKRPIEDIFDKDKVEAEDQRLAINDISASYSDVYRDGEKKINNLKKELRILEKDVQNYDPDRIVVTKRQIKRAEEFLLDVASDYKEKFLDDLK